MSLNTQDLANSLEEIFQKASDINNEMDYFDVAKEIVDALFSFVKLAQIDVDQVGRIISLIKVPPTPPPPAVPSAVPTVDEDMTFSGGLSPPPLLPVGSELSAIPLFPTAGSFDTVEQRVSLEASLVASFTDPGTSGFGAYGLPVFSLGTAANTAEINRINRFEDAVVEIVENRDRNLDVNIEGGVLIEDIEILQSFNLETGETLGESETEDRTVFIRPGFGSYIESLSSWSESQGGYISVDALVVMPPAAQLEMFTKLHNDMEQNAIPPSPSLSKIGTDIAEAITSAVEKTTVTAFFTKLSGTGFPFVSPNETMPTPTGVAYIPSIPPTVTQQIK